MQVNAIVTAVDLDDDLCEAVIRAGISLAERFGAKLRVIDGWPPLKDIGFLYARRAEIKEINRDDAARDARRRELEERVGRLEPRAKTMVPLGDASDAVAT